MTRRALRVLATILAGLVLAVTVATGVGPPAATAAAPPGPAATAPAASSSDPCPPGDRPCWKAHIERRAFERAWWTERRRQQEREHADRIWRANLERLAAHLRAQAAYPSGQCGGSLPPCRVMRRESRGDIRIWNGPRHGCYAPVGWTGRRSPCGGSTASGKWQMLRGTWGRHRGYLNAADAPERVQDERARQLWAGGRGCSHWNACG